MSIVIFGIAVGVVLHGCGYIAGDTQQPIAVGSYIQGTRGCIGGMYLTISIGIVTEAFIPYTTQDVGQAAEGIVTEISRVSRIRQRADVTDRIISDGAGVGAEAFLR